MFLTINDTNAGPRLTATMDNGTAVVVPMTKRGLKKFARFAIHRGYEGYRHSSSLDFPEDYGLDMDVHKTIETAFLNVAKELRFRLMGDIEYCGTVTKIAFKEI